MLKTVKLHYFAVLAPLLLWVGCSTFKHGIIRSESVDEAIQTAIDDFSNINRLYNKDSVFSVSYYDVIGRLVLDKNHQWTIGEPIEGIEAISIISNNSKLLLTADTKIGTKGGELPTRFIEKGGNLFFWWDDEYPLTEEALLVYEKYKLLQNNEAGVISIPDFIIDDAKKGVHYYFCKDDLSKYKKVITKKGIGYYDPPKIKCSYK